MCWRGWRHCLEVGSCDNMVPGGGHLGQSQTTQAKLAAAENVRYRKHEAITCGQGIEECTCRSAGDTVSLGSVVGGSDLNAEGMVLRVDRNLARGFEGVDNVWQDFEGNILWVGCVWGAEAGSVGKAAVPKAFNSGPSLVTGRNIAAPPVHGHSVQP
jgi:hypothetical protein